MEWQDKVLLSVPPMADLIVPVRPRDAIMPSLQHVILCYLPTVKNGFQRVKKNYKAEDNIDCF